MEGKGLGPGGISRHLAACPDREHQQHQSDDGNFTDAAGTDVAHVHAHEHGNRDGGHHGEHAPGAFRQRLDDNEGQHRQDDDHDHVRAEQGNRAGHLAHFLAHQLTQRAAIAACGYEQDHEILHRAREHHPGNQPERAGQITHLRCQHRPHQRPGTRDGGEMVAEQNVFIGGNVVEAVVVQHGRGGASWIEFHDFVCDEAAVVAIGHQINAHGGHHDPHGIDRFATPQRHHAQGRCP
ncbi:hypothetical protein SDC9_100876 [bioreactor metagenome]|uniref:Uncharacterized protein n=1 Tax=bioreactor metagenome TaxID=1076179 RepID=A0A645ATA1_9ZZZZ